MLMRYGPIISLALPWCGAALLCAAGPAFGTDVAVIGLFTNKAVVQVNGGPARTLSVGQKTSEGVTLVSVESGAATLDVAGRRQTLKLGQHHAAQGGTSGVAVTLNADARGHFVVDGQINGGSVRFIVDTGASLVSMSSADARRLGIDYSKGQLAQMATANGVAPAYRVRLATVRVGDVSLDNVDAVVMETQAMHVLLGMSFLNRMNMRRDGEVMVLTRRF
jgi:aspartyl protease family protein